MEDTEHFFNALREKYLITVDMEATVYIVIKLDWDYVSRTITLSMPNYARKALRRFQHILMGGKEYSPHICAPIQYGQKIQYTDPWMQRNTSLAKKPALFNKFVELSYIMPSLSTTPFSQPLVTFPQNSPRPKKH